MYNELDWRVGKIKVRKTTTLEDNNFERLIALGDNCWLLVAAAFLNLTRITRMIVASLTDLLEGDD